MHLHLELHLLASNSTFYLKWATERCHNVTPANNYHKFYHKPLLSYSAPDLMVYNRENSMHYGT